jgi:hypothetical protein
MIIDRKHYSVEVTGENKVIPVGTKLTCLQPVYFPSCWYIATAGPWLGSHINKNLTTLLGVYDQNGRVE